MDVGYDNGTSLKGYLQNYVSLRIELERKITRVCDALEDGRIGEASDIVASEGTVLGALLLDNKKFSATCRDVLHNSLIFGNYDRAQSVKDFVSTILPAPVLNDILLEASKDALKDAFQYNIAKAEDVLSFWINSLNRVEDPCYHYGKTDYCETKSIVAEVGEEVIIDKLTYGNTHDVPSIVSFMAKHGVVDLKPILTSDKMVQACCDGIIASASRENYQSEVLFIVDYMNKLGMNDKVDMVLHDAYRKGIDMNLECDEPKIAANIFRYFQHHHKGIAQKDDLNNIWEKIDK